ncbi:hypothetical protein LOC68_26645 [Blastopirellula sp. JC732]|uniref:Uncharacterized protein n=1 Tax=Blastopirellula sediminis TaxID=2894196 RepID=A0A9X1SJI1_9BACT|nr:hypothetical protein [Blastopirellula sediminis]MCC9604710.1 hypothetical protein [Blastopirellula sediminis]MCC9631991.1 hypothetical protein [Blastopirellula sediminis]
MSILLEQQTTILVIGVIGAAIIAGCLVQTGKKVFIPVFFLWIALAGCAALIEMAVVTPTEQVRDSVLYFGSALQSNDQARVMDVLSDIRPEMKQRARYILNLVTIDSVSVKQPIEVIFFDPQKTHCHAKFNVVVVGRLKSGAYAGGDRFAAFLVLDLIKEEDGKWRVADYETYDPRGEQAGRLAEPI